MKSIVCYNGIAAVPLADFIVNAKITDDISDIGLRV